MTDPAAPPPASPPPRRRFDRDLVVSGAAVVISLAALGASLVQTVVMRAQQHASVWPRLTVGLFGDSARFILTVRNAGVGPAQVAWAQVLFDGRPLDGWPALMDRGLSAAPMPAGVQHLSAQLRYSGVTGNVLVPGQADTVFSVSGRAGGMLLAVRDRIDLRACYCSVYDRCWRYEDAKPRAGTKVGSARITAVDRCDPAPEPQV